MEELVTNNPDLLIGGILRPARIRAGKTQEEIATAGSMRGRRIVGLWETDQKGIGLHRLEKVLDAYELNAEERREVMTRISRRKQEFLAKKIGVSMEESASFSTPNNRDNLPDEVITLNQLMALSPEKRQWVMETVSAHQSI